MKIRVLIVGCVLFFSGLTQAVAMDGQMTGSVLGGWAWSTDATALDGRDGSSGPGLAH